MENDEVTRLLDLENWDLEDETIALNLPEIDRAYLAKYIEKYDGIIIDLSQDLSNSVREAVASNKNTPISILKRLSISDKSIDVKNRAISTLKELRE
ncbi:hypothetical protein AN960_20870 [Bacillus sp. FJAT-25509]|uniref:hypothetical protein n=1 Tax=Bacillus sp. FJAT-25509 TaxID=1712029 RepID=UPI0006F319D9|nr:hypothetical protein [Bacillus sp. FJAT-25509]KQL33530.1 hypothetical protein AN960_20870 [Bacillus sp. FJAT-25509]